MHDLFDATLDRLRAPDPLRAPSAREPLAGQVGPEFLADVLARVALKAPSETSRVEIASGWAVGRPEDQRKIPQGTVSKAVKALMLEGLLEDGQTLLRNSEGRMLSPLRLGQAFALGGAKVTLEEGSPASVTSVLTGLDGEILERHQEELTDLGEDVWQTVAQVVHAEITALKHHRNKKRAGRGLEPLKLFGLGVEVGAHVSDGDIVRVPVEEGEPTRAPFGDTLDALFEHSLPVVIENDINALAVLATHGLDALGILPEDGTRYPESDFVVVAVLDEGVGGGLVMDGRLRRGGNGMAMEIGHLTVGYAPGERESGPDPSLRDFDPRCPCDAIGHLDAFATPKRIRERLGAASTAEIAQAEALFPDGRPSLEYTTFRAAGAVLGRGLAHIINIVNPSRLILCLPAELETDENSSGAAYLMAAKEEMGRAYSTGSKDAELMLIWLEHDVVPFLGARAAATCVLDSFIDHARGFDGCQTTQRRTNRKDTTAA